LYGEFLERDALIRNYMDFCHTFRTSKSVTLPEYIHATPNRGSDEFEEFFNDFEQDKSDDKDHLPVIELI